MVHLGRYISGRLNVRINCAKKLEAIVSNDSLGRRMFDLLRLK
jgi:hypothetical protein